MYYNENGAGSIDYIDNRNALSLEYGAAKFDPQVRFLEALQPEEADCISSSSERMEASGNHHDWSRGESGERTRSNSSSSSVKALNNVVMQVLDSVRASGYDEDVCNEFREHFSRLPSRYPIPTQSLYCVKRFLLLFVFVCFSSYSSVTITAGP